MLKHFDNIVIAECSSGQKKLGVDEGGKYICDELKITSNIVFEKRIFNDINSEYENGYYILSKFLENVNQNGKKTLLIGGDHSLGISSVDFLLNKYQDKLRVLWIDAHADINDHLTSLTGNIHGMPLGYHHISRTDKPYWRNKNQFRLDSSQLYYFGIRDLDPAEVKLIKEEHIGYSNKIDEDLIRFIDESEVLTPADYANHIDKWAFKVPFVCGATNLGEALRRINEGAAMIRSKGEAGTGDVSNATTHMRSISGEIRKLSSMREDELYVAAKELQAPYELVKEVATTGKLPVVLFTAGGIATPADAAMMMQLGADGVFVGSGIFKSGNPEQRAAAIVKAVTFFDDPKVIADVSRGLGEAMVGINVADIPVPHRLAERGW